MGGVIERMQSSVVPMVATLKEISEKQHRGLREEIGAQAANFAREIAEVQACVARPAPIRHPPDAHLTPA